MPRKRLEWWRVVEILRLSLDLGRSYREIGLSVSASHATVSKYVRRAKAAGLSWPLPEYFGARELKAALFPEAISGPPPRPRPDWAKVHLRLARDREMTLQRLWQEYFEAHPNAYRYSWFCARYRDWCETGRGNDVPFEDRPGWVANAHIRIQDWNPEAAHVRNRDGAWGAGRPIRA